MKDGSERFEKDLREGLGDTIKDDEVAKNLWSSLANVDWYHPESNEKAGYSFRAAGALIAELRGEGGYMDWYCCGPYATVSDHIARVLKKRGWIYDDMPPICDEPGCLKNAGCGYPTKDGGYRTSCGEHHREYKAKQSQQSSGDDRSGEGDSSPDQ